MDAALKQFVAMIDKAGLPSMVTVCFSLAGGTGSGMMVDLARHLSNVKLGRRIPVIGVGQLPHSGDPDTYKDSPALYTTLNDLDCMLDDDKNAGVTAVWGDLYRQPVHWRLLRRQPRAELAAPDRLHHDGRARDPAEHQGNGHQPFRCRQASCASSSSITAATCSGRWRPSGLTGAPHETVSAKSRNWTMFNVAKLTHPGVQVLPGEGAAKWDNVISQWIDFTPNYDGLKDGFKDRLRRMLHLWLA